MRRTCNHVSDKVIYSVGAPQGTVLAPFFFILCTADFRYNSSHCHLQKLTDSAIVGFITGGDNGLYIGLQNFD